MGNQEYVDGNRRLSTNAPAIAALVPAIVIILHCCLLVANIMDYPTMPLTSLGSASARSGSANCT